MTDGRHADRAAIVEVLARYCHAVDHLDWDELASVYHEDANRSARCVPGAGCRIPGMGEAAVHRTLLGDDALDQQRGNRL